MNKEQAKKLTFILSSYFTKKFSSKYCRCKYVKLWVQRYKLRINSEFCQHEKTDELIKKEKKLTLIGNASSILSRLSICRKIERRLLSVQTALRIESLKWARNGTLQLNCNLFPLILTLKYSEFCLYPSRFLYLAGKPQVFFLSLLLLKKHILFSLIIWCMAHFCSALLVVKGHSFHLFCSWWMIQSIFISHKVCKWFETTGFHLRRSRSRNRKRGRKSAYDLVKIKNRSHKRSHKRNGIEVRTVPFSSGPGCSLSSRQVLQKPIALFAG